MDNNDWLVINTLAPFNEIKAFNNEADANEFAEDHGNCVVYNWNQDSR